MAVMSRHGGFGPISSYAVLGDGRTVALVARDGAIDWCPVTALNTAPAFAALLDPAHGGQVELEPAVEYSAERHYRSGTAVLETSYITATGTVTITDCLNRLGDHPLPWTELAQVVHAETGSVPMRWRVRPGSRFGTVQPNLHARDAIPLMQLGSETIAVLTSNAGRSVGTPHEVVGEFTAEPGVTSLLALTATDDEPVMIPRAEEVIRRVCTTADGWRAWRRRIHYPGPHAEAVVRSALTLRLLTVTATGASVAASTTSLPEAIGGDRNYDYRFTWVRDASFALTSLGLTEEVHDTLSWLLRAVMRAGASRLLHPGRPRPPVEAGVELGGAEGSRIAGQPVTGRKPRRVQLRVPVIITPPRRADPDHHRGPLSRRTGAPPAAWCDAMVAASPHADPAVLRLTSPIGTAYPIHHHFRGREPMYREVSGLAIAGLPQITRTYQTKRTRLISVNWAGSPGRPPGGLCCLPLREPAMAARSSLRSSQRPGPSPRRAPCPPRRRQGPPP
jgi:Glycosyl hydrolases family 15/Trehalase-like, N-terminal